MLSINIYSIVLLLIDKQSLWVGKSSPLFKKDEGLRMRKEEGVKDKYLLSGYLLGRYLLARYLLLITYYLYPHPSILIIHPSDHFGVIF